MECTVHKLVADIAVLADRQVLLVRYKDTRSYDGQQGWFLPDDYLMFVEHPDEAAARILREQVGMAAPRITLDHIESFGGGKTAWHLIFHYKATLRDALPVTAGTNVLAAQWFPLHALPASTEMAHEGWALDVLQRMQGRP